MVEIGIRKGKDIIPSVPNHGIRINGYGREYWWILHRGNVYLKDYNILGVGISRVGDGDGEGIDPRKVSLRIVFDEEIITGWNQSHNSVRGIREKAPNRTAFIGIGIRERQGNARPSNGRIIFADGERKRISLFNDRGIIQRNHG